MAKNIEDMATPKLKRYYQRRQRVVWRRERWLADHTRHYPDYDNTLKNLQWHRHAGEAAKKELQHRGHSII